MFKIGEFSGINRITVKALRLYDEMDLLKPDKVDGLTGYRFYTAEQLPKLQKILALKQIGFSLNEIRDLLGKDASSHWVQILERKKNDIMHDIAADQEKLRHLKTYLATLRKEHRMEYHITVKDLPAVAVASVRKTIKNYDEFNSLYPRMGELMGRAGVECLNPGYCFTLYHDGEYKETDIDVEICEAVKTPGKNLEEMVFKYIPAVSQAACVIHKGPYATIGKAYAALSRWIEDNGLESADLMRESYIDGIWNQPDPDKWITEIQAPIRARAAEQA